MSLAAIRYGRRMLGGGYKGWGTGWGRWTKKKRGGQARIRYRLRRLESTSTKEIKKHDKSDSATPDNSGEVIFLTSVEQGDQSIQREGLSINLLSIYMKGYITSNSTNTDNVMVRLILFKDRYNLGALPAVTDLLESASIVAFTEHDEKRRFKVMWDKLFDISNTEASQKRSRPIKYYKKFKKSQKIDYRGTGSAVSNAGSCNLFLLIISNAATNLPTVVTNWRFKFTG